MNAASQRLVLRLIHLIFAIPIIGYIYSPFEKLPEYAPKVRYVFVPVLVLTGLWMWKAHVLNRRLTNVSTSSSH